MTRDALGGLNGTAPSETADSGEVRSNTSARLVAALPCRLRCTGGFPTGEGSRSAGDVGDVEVQARGSEEGLGEATLRGWTFLTGHFVDEGQVLTARSDPERSSASRSFSAESGSVSDNDSVPDASSLGDGGENSESESDAEADDGVRPSEDSRSSDRCGLWRTGESPPDATPPPAPGDSSDSEGDDVQGDCSPSSKWV